MSAESQRLEVTAKTEPISGKKVNENQDKKVLLQCCTWLLPQPSVQLNQREASACFVVGACWRNGGVRLPVPDSSQPAGEGSVVAHLNPDWLVTSGL